MIDGRGERQPAACIDSMVNIDLPLDPFGPHLTPEQKKEEDLNLKLDRVMRFKETFAMRWQLGKMALVMKTGSQLE